MVENKELICTGSMTQINLEQVTLEMSRLLSEFRKNLSQLQIITSANNTIKNSSRKIKLRPSQINEENNSGKLSMSGRRKACGNMKKMYDNKNARQLTLFRPLKVPNGALTEIKNAVEKAKCDRKTFTVCGNFETIRRALVQRGWLEKIRLSYNTHHRENLRRLQSMKIEELAQKLNDGSYGYACRRIIISKLLADHQVDFYWDDYNDAFKVNDDNCKCTLINKFKRCGFSYTSKQGLCETVKRAHWYQKPGTSVIRHPRSYSLTNRGDPREFIDDYKTTAAISLLKWITETNTRPKAKLISDNGKVPVSTFHFALEECEKIIRRAKHEDIDSEIEDATDHQWNFFLDNYYKLVHVGNHFKKHPSLNETKMVQKASNILKELGGHMPHLKMDGLMNIWILKPVAGCRGQGIHICRTLQYILQVVKTRRHMRYVIQKYIEKPLLIHNTKFDIRQWFLISSSCPLTIWIYKECYLRFSSQRYNLRNLHESVHLTNNSVQCKYRNNNKDSALPSYNMWDRHQFESYLKEKGHPNAFAKIIYPEIKQCITGAILLNQDNLDMRRNSFELYGADFMLDEEFRPWLIEINAKPALYASTPVTAVLCPQVLEDTVKVIIDLPRKRKANTGNFELLYREKVPRMPKVDKERLKLEGKPLTMDYFCNSLADDETEGLKTKEDINHGWNIVTGETAVEIEGLYGSSDTPPQKVPSLVKKVTSKGEEKSKETDNGVLHNIMRFIKNMRTSGDEGDSACPKTKILL